MRRYLTLFLLLGCLSSGAQTVFGYWYGTANVKTASSANNYLVEMILNPEGGRVKGVLNYYFRNAYRSLAVEGSYNASTRLLSLKSVPMIYFGSIVNLEVDCQMDFSATLRVAQAGSTLSGLFTALPDYKYSCPDIQCNLSLDGEVSHKDSVLKAISEFKESFQVWTPAPEDTVVAANVIARKVVNFPVEREFKERKTEVTDEIEVESDTLRVDIYDNGEVDGDIISIFYNQQLIIASQKLTHRSIKVTLPLDSVKGVNELSMFAENLGLIPPNTALVLINDGKNKFELRLSSSLEKNATIRIKRKKDGVKVPK